MSTTDIASIPVAPAAAAAAALEERLALAGASIEALSTGLVSAVYIDRDSDDVRLATVSDDIAEITGLTPAEAIDLPGGWLDIVHPDDRQAFLDEAARAAAAPPFHLEYRIVHRDGSIRWVRDVTRPVSGSGHAPTALIGVLTDITPVRRARELAAEASRRMRATLDQLPVAVYIYSRTPGALEETYSVNTNMQRLLGYSAEEWRGGRAFWFHIMHPEDRGRVLVTEQSVIDAEGSFSSMEYRVVTRDGRVLWVRDDSQRIDNRTSGVEIWQGVFTDITAQVESAQRAREADHRFRQLIQHSRDLFIIIAPDGTRRYISPSYQRLLGYSEEELIGRSALSLTHPDDEPILREAIRVSLETGEPTPLLELRIRHRDGGYRHFEAIGVNLLHEPSVGGIVFTSRDVSERHRAEETQRFLAAVIEAAEDAIITRTPEGIVLSWNAGAERLYGYSAEEMIGKPISKVIPPELRPGFTDIDARLHRGERIPPGESVRLHKDGSRIDISYSLAPIFDREGRASAAVAIVRDITEQKRTESALRASETRLRGFMDASLDCVIGMDHEGAVTDFNPAAERTFKVMRDEVLGRPLSDVIMPPDLGKLHDAGLATYLRTGHGPALNRRVETIGLRANGETFPLELSAVPYQVDGKSWFAGYLRDITDRVEMEGALRESEERARGAFEHGPIGMALVRLDGSILQANHALQDLLGRDGGELGRQSWPTLVAPADRNDVTADFARLIAREITSSERDCRFLRADGSLVWVRQAVSLVDDRHGDPSAFVCQLVDLTRAREADRLKNEFVATVSHELRTPLTAITGFVDLLLDGAAGELNPTMERFLTVAQGNGRRLSTLINDLLDMSKIEAGKVEMRLVPIDLAAAVQQASISVIPQIEARDQALSIDIPADLPPVQADSHRLVQVLTNLLSNANKYTPEGGRIRLTASVRGDLAHVAIADTGIGLSPEEQSLVFDRFYQAQGSNRRITGGTGLGLAITRSLVELMGGSIGLASEPGAGSTFWFTLPLAAGENP